MGADFLEKFLILNAVINFYLPWKSPALFIEYPLIKSLNPSAVYFNQEKLPNLRNFNTTIEKG